MFKIPIIVGLLGGGHVCLKDMLRVRWLSSDAKIMMKGLLQNKWNAYQFIIQSPVYAVVGKPQMH